MIRILAVDDDETALEAVSKALQPLGEVDAVPDGRQALELIGVTDYDLIVVDIAMPPPSGLDVVGMLRQSRIRAPILVCSGYLTDKTRKELDLYEGVGVVTKPFKGEALLGAARRLLNPQPNPAR